MKITKKVFEQMIREELEERCQKGYKTHPTTKTKEMYGKTYRNCIKAEAEEKGNVMPDYSDYEAEDLSSDEQMIVLLKDMLAQLKVLNYTMTPAKTVGASAGEKAKASYTVAESEDK
jgi:hypothetical protein